MGDPWDEAEEIPPACPCGNEMWWWWDNKGLPHCVRCEPEPVLATARVASWSFLWKNTLREDVSEVVEEGKAAKRALVGAGVVEKEHNFVKEAGNARRLHRRDRSS